MKIPVIRHYYSLITENVDSVPKQNSGEGRGSLRPGDLRVGRGWTTLQTKQGEEVCVLVFGGIDAPDKMSEFYMIFARKCSNIS